MWKRLAHALRQEPRGKEMQVLRCLAAGYSDDRIMETLDIELGTVREYLGRLYRRLKCSNRTGAVGAALEAMGKLADQPHRPGSAQ